MLLAHVFKRETGQDLDAYARRYLFRPLGIRDSYWKHAPNGVDAILFNGGFFIPDICRDRVADVVASWYGRRPLVFENRDLDLAVAVGVE